MRCSLQALDVTINRVEPRAIGRVLVYPPRGRLIFATDFHGQLEDFRRVVAVYRERRARDEDVYLLFAGDFVHGPAYDRAGFPEHLGDFHEDGTPEILEELEALLAADPRVRSLLGNHEHAHVGGPHTQKFHRRPGPDEVEWLEARLGPERAARARALFAGFSLAALAPCGLLFLHGAPAVRSAGFAEVAAATLEGHERLPLERMSEVPVLGEILWAKGADALLAEWFLGRMSFEGVRPRVAVYGHDVIREGYWRAEENQLVVSTSFGLRRAKKTLCEVDLESRYRCAADLREGQELVPLYPDAAGATARP